MLARVKYWLLVCCLLCAYVLWNLPLQISLALFYFLHHVHSFFPLFLLITQCRSFPSSPLFHSISFLFSSPCHLFFPSSLPLSSLCLTGKASTQQVLILLETGPEAVCVWLLACFVLFTSPEIITVYRYPSANERLPVPESVTVCVISQWYFPGLSLSCFLSLFGFMLSFVVGSSEKVPCWADSYWLMHVCLRGPSVCHFFNTTAHFSGNLYVSVTQPVIGLSTRIVLTKLCAYLCFIVDYF